MIALSFVGPPSFPPANGGKLEQAKTLSRANSLRRGKPKPRCLRLSLPPLFTVFGLGGGEHSDTSSVKPIQRVVSGMGIGRITPRASGEEKRLKGHTDTKKAVVQARAVREPPLQRVDSSRFPFSTAPYPIRRLPARTQRSTSP